jgi:hypothetical protein
MVIQLSYKVEGLKYPLQSVTQQYLMYTTLVVVTNIITHLQKEIPLLLLLTVTLKYIYLPTYGSRKYATNKNNILPIIEHGCY